MLSATEQASRHGAGQIIPTNERGNEMMPTITPNHETTIEPGGFRAIRGDVMIEFVNLGEGRDGDYQPSDPEDINLLRFDVSRREDGEWVGVEGASYCTQVAASTPAAERGRLLSMLMDEFYQPVTDRVSIKRAAERLSWIETAIAPGPRRAGESAAGS
jgi:hypothetical protein